jgi:hypothetical protein
MAAYLTLQWVLDQLDEAFAAFPDSVIGVADVPVHDGSEIQDTLTTRTVGPHRIYRVSLAVGRSLFITVAWRFYVGTIQASLASPVL